MSTINRIRASEGSDLTHVCATLSIMEVIQRDLIIQVVTSDGTGRIVLPCIQLLQPLGKISS